MQETARESREGARDGRIQKSPTDAQEGGLGTAEAPALWLKQTMREAGEAGCAAMSDLLFYSRGNLSDALDAQRKKVGDEIAGMDGDHILKVSEDDLLDYIVAKHRIEPPAIRHEKIGQLEPSDAQVDVSQDIRRAIFDRTSPHYITGTRVEIVVPFDGEPDCFQFQPSTFTFNPPRGRLKGQELHLVFEGADLEGDSLKQAYENELRRIEEYLRWVRNDIEQFNTSLPDLVRKAVTARKQKLLKDAGLSAALGIPVQRRGEAALTFAPPEIRRKAPVIRPEVIAGPYVPEPALPSEEYEFILGVIHQVVVGIERSPETFARMGEEDLRNIILVHLNGHYKGGATGETFNVGGKTDILIRYEGKNIFIAECKFWGGAKELLDAIDQVLRYVGWRDTKAAVIIFNRNRDHTAVIQKIKDTVSHHPCFKRALAHKGESDLRYQFHQPGDKNREVLLAVLAFDVPYDGAGADEADEQDSSAKGVRTPKSRSVKRT